MSQDGRQQKNGEISLVMRQRQRQQENGSIRHSETEEYDGVDRNTILDPKGVFMFKWHAMFLLSCMIAVLCVDPLFFYLPVINENYKCLMLDRRLLITAISLRSVCDIIYLVNMIFGYFSLRSRRTRLVKDARQITKKYFRSNFLIDILAILPIPQVLVPIIFSRIKRSDLRKLLNFFVLFQYVPRVLRIHRSWTSESSRKFARRVWIKAACNIFLYILASHVLGGLWYFFSIQRETACWHVACENHIGCTPSAFYRAGNLGNYTFLDDNCPVHTPNTTLFDFGIFQEALQFGTVSSTNIPQKIMHCFWWGLRNLSSLGQNLQTSTYFWENCFAVFISFVGLLLFLVYIMGNVQMATEKAARKAAEMEDTNAAKNIIRYKMGLIRSEIESWMTGNQLPCDMKERIINSIQRRLKKNKDFDMEKPISHLSKDIITEITHHLCLPQLKKVPILENHGENLLERICESLKPKYYNEDIYILHEGEPLTAMLFITKGNVWCFKTNNDKNGEGIVSSVQCIEKGEFYGEELLEWGFNGFPTPKLSDLPMSTKTVKTHSKVEAFVLTANDLKNLVPTHGRAASAAKGFAQGVMRQP